VLDIAETGNSCTVPEMSSSGIDPVNRELAKHFHPSIFWDGKLRTEKIN
jgi:hypothetical protein